MYNGYVYINNYIFVSINEKEKCLYLLNFLFHLFIKRCCFGKSVKLKLEGVNFAPNGMPVQPIPAPLDRDHGIAWVFSYFTLLQFFVVFFCFVLFLVIYILSWIFCSTGGFYWGFFVLFLLIIIKFLVKKILNSFSCYIVAVDERKHLNSPLYSKIYLAHQCFLIKLIKKF